MAPLDYLVMATSLFSIAVGIQLVVRPASIGWQPRTAQIVGASMAILALITIVLAIMQSHGKA